MYQLNPRAQASKLASLPTRWQIAIAPRQQASYLRIVITKLTNLALLRAIPGNSFDTTGRPDPRDPRNW